MTQFVNRTPEDDVDAVLTMAAGSSGLDQYNLGVHFLRVEGSPPPLPALVYSLAEAEFYDTIDGRFVDGDTEVYRVQIWAKDRQNLLDIYRELLRWLVVESNIDAAVSGRTFSLIPVRAIDTPHIGFQDREVYERNLFLQYIYG